MFFYALDKDLPNIDKFAVGPTSLDCTTPLTHSDVARFPGEKLETEMRKLSGHIAAATCSFLVMLGEFDARKLWAPQECYTCAHWLSWRCGISMGTARDQVRVARRLRELPKVTEAFGKGQLSYSKARAICRVATAETEEQWITLAGNATAKILDRMASAWAQSKVRGEEWLKKMMNEETKEQESRRLRKLTWLQQPNGDLRVELRIPAGVESEIFRNAIERCLGNPPAIDPMQPVAQNSSEEDVPAEFVEEADRLEQRRLDALINALVQTSDCEASLAPPADITICHHATQDVSAETRAAPENVSAETSTADRHDVIPSSNDDWLQTLQQGFGGVSLSVTERGLVMSPHMMELLACDAGVRHRNAPWDGNENDHDCCSESKLIDGLSPSEIDEKGLDPQRHPNTKMRRQIFARDGGKCQFPGCERRHRLAAHHIVHWIHGGPTTLENLILLCPKHHHAIHDRDWSLTGTASNPVFKRPDGHDVPQVPTLAAGNLHHLIKTHTAQSLEIGPSSASGTWYGESIDWDCFFAAFPIETPQWVKDFEQPN